MKDGGEVFDTTLRLAEPGAVVVTRRAAPAAPIACPLLRRNVRHPQAGNQFPAWFHVKPSCLWISSVENCKPQHRGRSRIATRRDRTDCPRLSAIHPMIEESAVTLAAEPPREPAEEAGQTDHGPAPDELEIRASDTERNQVVELLSEHASAGRLTLAELEDRVGLAYAARTRAELSELTRDLPELGRSSTRRKVTRWFVAIMGGSTRRGRQRFADRVNAIAIMGGDDIDLREAEIDGDELTINVFSLMGGPDIYVPDSVEVEVSGFAIMGGNDERGSQRLPRAGAPLIHIRSFAFMGGIDLWRLPAQARGKSLKQARRDAKALERAGGS